MNHNATGTASAQVFNWWQLLDITDAHHDLKNILMAESNEETCSFKLTHFELSYRYVPFAQNNVNVSAPLPIIISLPVTAPVPAFLCVVLVF